MALRSKSWISLFAMSTSASSIKTTTLHLQPSLNTFWSCSSIWEMFVPSSPPVAWSEDHNVTQQPGFNFELRYGLSTSEPYILKEILDDVSSYKHIHNWDEKLLTSPLNALVRVGRRYQRENAHGWRNLLAHSTVEEILPFRRTNHDPAASQGAGSTDNQLFFTKVGTRSYGCFDRSKTHSIARHVSNQVVLYYPNIKTQTSFKHRNEPWEWKRPQFVKAWSRPDHVSTKSYIILFLFWFFVIFTFHALAISRDRFPMLKELPF